MLLYFSSEKNVSIFDEEIKKLGIDLKVETDRCLTDYIRVNMNKLNHLEYLAIDLDYIVDDDIEIINTLSAFKVCNSKITIIIVTFEREKGDILLGKLFANGIYNFITSKNEIDRQKEVKICLDHTQNNNYANAIGFKVEVLEEPKEKSKGFWSNLLENFKLKNKKEEKEFKIKETKLKKENQFKKQKYVTKEEMSIKQNDENNLHNDDFLVEEQSIKKQNKSNKSLSQVVREIKNDSCGLMTTFKNIEKDIQLDEKASIFIEIIEDTKVLNYFGNVVGIIEDSTAIIDIDFETDILKRYCNDNNLNCVFKENIYDKLANFS